MEEKYRHDKLLKSYFENNDVGYFFEGILNNKSHSNLLFPSEKIALGKNINDRLKDNIAVHRKIYIML